MNSDRAEWQDWERWAREVLTDFKIPFDNHKVGMRLAITQWMADKLDSSRTTLKERELCKRDVCMYCGGRALGYNQLPEGPNEAGNYTHASLLDRRENDVVLCYASSIFARERFERLSQ